MGVLHSTYNLVTKLKSLKILRMTNLARQCVWWPKIDNDNEMKVKGCSTYAISGLDLPTKYCSSSMRMA